MNVDSEKYKEFMGFIGNLELNDIQKEQLKIMRAYIKAYEGVTFECVNVTGFNEKERAERDEKQKIAQDTINKRVANNYNADNGVLQ